MERSNYAIHYWPREGICGHSVSIEVSEEFIEFARKQIIDRQKYEEIGLGIIRACGWKNFKSKDISGAPSICGWEEDTGLLFYVNVPGNAAGVALEEGINGWEYHPHNMDNMSQASAVLGIMTYYLNEIELNIPRK